MGIHNEEHEGSPPTLQALQLPPTPSATSGDNSPAGTSFTGTPVTPVVERKLRPRVMPRLPAVSPSKRPQLDMLAEGNPLGGQPVRKRASEEWEKGSIERAFTLVHEVEQRGIVALSPSFAVAEAGDGGGEGSELGQEGAKEDVELGTKRKRKIEDIAKEGKKMRRPASEKSKGKNEDENAAQKATSAGTLRSRRTETSRLHQGKVMHSIQDLTEEIEDVIHVEQKITSAQPTLSIAVRGKSCGLRPLMQKHVAEMVDHPAEDDSWSVQSDRGVDTEREVEDTEDEYGKQKDKVLETITSERNLQERSRDDGYILLWNEYTVDNISADQDHASSPNPLLYTTTRRDSGVSLGRHCVDPQLLNTVPHPTLLIRGGEASTVMISPPAYPSEQLRFGLGGQYEERELYKALGEELERFGQDPGRAAEQAMEGIWNNVFQDVKGQKEGQLKLEDVKAAEPEAQVDLQLGVVDPELSEESEYPVLHFAVPSPFGGGAKDERYGGSEAEDGWISSASNETVEIPEPGSDKTKRMAWSSEEWPGWAEGDSPVWVEQDWGKWAESVRGPYGQERF
ncbi:hypothetical protein BGX38DRAFT_812048 [Terfezia claveryi]|nr:hypothetical protein BGX38DRAFT_812048 [Terfezia claveryi]